MRKVGFLLMLALIATVPNLARAQVRGAPPTNSYTLKLRLEDAKGNVLYKESRKCDPLRWCEGKPYSTKVQVNGHTRVFFIKTKWEFGVLRYQRMFADPKRVMGPASLEFPFRKNEKEVESYYDTDSGTSWKGQEAFKKGPIAKLTMEISY